MSNTDSLIMFVSTFFAVLMWKLSSLHFENGSNYRGWISLFVSAWNGAYVFHLLDM